jgi:hypothetical protein
MASRDVDDQFSRAARDAFNAVRVFKLQPDRSWHAVLKVPLGDFLSSKNATEAVALIEATLKRLPKGELETTNWLLSIPPASPEGFAIDISHAPGSGFRGLFGDLEEEFATLDEALMWVGRALSSSYQLKITFVGNSPREWRLEPIPCADHLSSATLAHGHISLLSLFQPKTTIIRRNAFLEK